MKDHQDELNKQLEILESLNKSLKVVQDIKQKLNKSKLGTIQKNYEKELKTLSLEYDLFKQKKLRTESRFKSATSIKNQDQFMAMFGGSGNAANIQGREIINEEILGGYGLEVNKYKRLMDDYGHRRRFKRVVTGITK